MSEVLFSTASVTVMNVRDDTSNSYMFIVLFFYQTERVKARSQGTQSMCMMELFILTVHFDYPALHK